MVLNEELKLLARDTENILSKALHQRLTDQFVDKKLNILIKEISHENLKSIHMIWKHYFK